MVHVVNVDTGDEVTVLSQSDGSFSADVSAVAEDTLSVFAVDAAANQGPALTLPPVLPPSLTL